MPGGGTKETSVTEAVRTHSGLTFREQDKPLGYLRSRNALKIVLVSRTRLLDVSNEN